MSLFKVRSLPNLCSSETVWQARERWTAEPSNLGQEEEYDTGDKAAAPIRV